MSPITQSCQCLLPVTVDLYHTFSNRVNTFTTVGHLVYSTLICHTVNLASDVALTLFVNLQQFLGIWLITLQILLLTFELLYQVLSLLFKIDSTSHVMLLKVIIINDFLAQIVHILLQILVQFDETSIRGTLHRSLQVSVKDAAVPLFAI